MHSLALGTKTKRPCVAWESTKTQNGTNTVNAAKAIYGRAQQTGRDDRQS